MNIDNQKKEQILRYEEMARLIISLSDALNSEEYHKVEKNENEVSINMNMCNIRATDLIKIRSILAYALKDTKIIANVLRDTKIE